MLDALGEGQVALESAVEGLTVIWCLLFLSPSPPAAIKCSQVETDDTVMHQIVKEQSSVAAA